MPITTKGSTVQEQDERVVGTAHVIGEIMIEVGDEVLSAMERYPWWPTDIVHAAAIAAEEAGEVTKGVNNHYWDQGKDSLHEIRKEAIQAAAMYVRFIHNLDKAMVE